MPFHTSLSKKTRLTTVPNDYNWTIHEAILLCETRFCCLHISSCSVVTNASVWTVMTLFVSDHSDAWNRHLSGSLLNTLGSMQYRRDWVIWPLGRLLRVISAHSPHAPHVVSRHSFLNRSPLFDSLFWKRRSRYVKMHFIGDERLLVTFRLPRTLWVLYDAKSAPSNDLDWPL